MRVVEAPLPNVLAEKAAARPNAPYVLDVAGRTSSLSESLEASYRWAHAFRRIGVAAGDVVVTMQFNGIDSILGWIGLGWLGAIEAPINIDYRGDLLVHALNLTRARVMLLLPQFAERIAEIAPRLQFLETVIVAGASDTPELPFKVLTGSGFLDSAVATEPDRTPRARDIGSVLFTSGTTGPSKAVLLPWGQIHASAIATYPIDDLTQDDVLYSAGPAYHIGSKAFPYAAALSGASVVIRPYISFSEWVSDHERFGITTTVASPVAFRHWLDAPDASLCKVRNFLMSVPVAGAAEFKERFGARSHTAYSMTELSIPICSSAWNDGPPTSCGRHRTGYPGYEVRLVDEDDNLVPDGAVGELIVRTDAPWTINAGYLNMPEATAEAWRNGWFHTGDAMRRDENGYFFFMDRLKDSIRRRAENISSIEVESIVIQHPAIAECAAIAVKMSERPGADEEVKIVAVLGPGETLTPEELIEYLIPRMPRFMIPRFVEFVPAMPRTPTMKVRKVELRTDARNDRTWDRDAAGIVLPR